MAFLIVIFGSIIVFPSWAFEICSLASFIGILLIAIKILANAPRQSTHQKVEPSDASAA
ncbi:MAG: hypothetical protein HWE13_07990 [Gammaproteobacteria bacterium]|nr:hypothetical protein [Gammaproteobacteria bacterium]NVK88052.1 hypothetical protein [Gammaproteobacteria bacterium]